MSNQIDQRWWCVLWEGASSVVEWSVTHTTQAVARTIPKLNTTQTMATAAMKSWKFPTHVSHSIRHAYNKKKNGRPKHNTNNNGNCHNKIMEISHVFTPAPCYHHKHNTATAATKPWKFPMSSYPCLHYLYTITQPKHNTATAAIKPWKFLTSSHMPPALHHRKNTTWQPLQQNHGIFPHLHTRACATHISPNTTQQPPQQSMEISHISPALHHRPNTTRQPLQQNHGNFPCLHTCACTTHSAQTQHSNRCNKIMEISHACLHQTKHTAMARCNKITWKLSHVSAQTQHKQQNGNCCNKIGGHTQKMLTHTSTHLTCTSTNMIQTT